MNALNLRIRIWQIIRRLHQQEDGQDMVEYALLLAFIALAVVALLSGVKTQIKGCFQRLAVLYRARIPPPPDSQSGGKVVQ